MYSKIFILALFCASTLAYQPCKKVKAAGVDQDFVKGNNGGEGFHVPMHSNCENCKPNEAFKWMAGRTLKEEKMTWDMDFKTKWGDFDLPFVCKYQKFEQQKCAIDLSKAPKLKGKFDLKGEIIITKSDNESYVAGTICILGKENLWWVVSTNEELEDDVRSEIIEHFESFKFKGEDNVAVEDDFKKSPVFIRKIDLKSGGHGKGKGKGKGRSALAAAQAQDQDQAE